MTSSAPKEQKFPGGFERLKVGGVSLLTDTIAKEAREIYEAGLKRTLASENFDFLKAVYACYKEKDPKKIKKQIQDIIDTYVKEDSPTPANLTSAQIAAITTAINPTVDIFESAVANISALLITNDTAISLGPKIAKKYGEELQSAIDNILNELNTFTQKPSLLNRVFSREDTLVELSRKIAITMQENLRLLKDQINNDPENMQRHRQQFDAICAQAHDMQQNVIGEISRKFTPENPSSPPKPLPEKLHQAFDNIQKLMQRIDENAGISSMSRQQIKNLLNAKITVKEDQAAALKMKGPGAAAGG